MGKNNPWGGGEGGVAFHSAKRKGGGKRRPVYFFPSFYKSLKEKEDYFPLFRFFSLLGGGGKFVLCSLGKKGKKQWVFFFSFSSFRLVDCGRKGGKKGDEFSYVVVFERKKKKGCVRPLKSDRGRA